MLDEHTVNAVPHPVVLRLVVADGEGVVALFYLQLVHLVGALAAPDEHQQHGRVAGLALGLNGDGQVQRKLALELQLLSEYVPFSIRVNKVGAR